MRQVNLGKDRTQPHDSHDMGKWEGTICSWIGRFGRERECLKCGAKEIECGGGGSLWFDEELRHTCVSADKEEG